MTPTEQWLVAAGLLVGGIALGAVLGWVVRRRLARSQGDAVSPVAGAAGLLVFWSLTLIGTLLATAMIRPETLEDVPRQLLEYAPRLIAAGLILVAGYAVGLAAARLVGFGLERAGGRTGARAGSTVRVIVMGAAVILALAQIGVDTTILVLLTGIAGLAVAMAAALLIGLGGRDLAAEIAAGRYLASKLPLGSHIKCGAEEGEVVARHPAMLEIEVAPDTTRLIPYSALLEQGVGISRPVGD